MSDFTEVPLKTARAPFDLRVALVDALMATEALDETCPVFIEGPWEFLGTVTEAKAVIEHHLRAATHMLFTVSEQAGWIDPGRTDEF